MCTFSSPGTMRLGKVEGKTPLCRVRELRMAREIRECLGDERFSRVAAILQLPADVSDKYSEVEGNPSASGAALKSSFVPCVLPEQKILYAKKRRCTLIANSTTSNKESFSTIGQKKSRPDVSSKISESSCGSRFLFPPTPRPTTFTSFPRNQINPYLRFIRQSPEKANIWKPPEVITEQAVLKMPLMERGLYVSNLIASKFCAWLRTLGTDNSVSSINEDVLKELFEIQLENPTSTGIETRIKELPFLPDVISDAENIPQRSFRALHRLNVLMDAKTAHQTIIERKSSAGLNKKRWRFARVQKEEKYALSGMVPEDIAKFEYKFFDDPPIHEER